MKKFGIISSLVIILALAGFLYFKFYFPVATDGVKSGELNYLVYKGYIWKTYEGKLIQAGFRSRDGGSGVQSNEFEFSVVDKDLAQALMGHSGQVVSLRYRQYNGALPWRGMQRNIVYAIDKVEPRANSYTDQAACDAASVGALPYESVQ